MLKARRAKPALTIGEGLGAGDVCTLLNPQWTKRPEDLDFGPGEHDPIQCFDATEAKYLAAVQETQARYQQSAVDAEARIRELEEEALREEKFHGEGIQPSASLREWTARSDTIIYLGPGL